MNTSKSQSVERVGTSQGERPNDQIAAKKSKRKADFTIDEAAAKITKLSNGNKKSAFEFRMFNYFRFKYFGNDFFSLYFYFSTNVDTFSKSQSVDRVGSSQGERPDDQIAAKKS